MPYGRRSYSTRKPGRRTSVRRPAKMVKKVARKRPAQARYALAKRVDALSRAVKKNTSHRYGDLQMGQQVKVGTLALASGYPALFCMDEFTVAADGTTPSSLNSAAIYQLDTGGNIVTPAFFKNYNHNFGIIIPEFDGWQGCRTDQCDTGKYLATSASYEFKAQVLPRARDIRVKYTFFKLRRNKMTNAPSISLKSMLQQGKHLLEGNHLCPVHFDVKFEKHMYFNNAESAVVGPGTVDGIDGGGPFSRRWNHYFKMNKLVTQNKTYPAAGGIPTPEGAWKVETGQRDIYDPLYCMISTNLPAESEGSVLVDIDRVVRWKDSVGQAY